MPPRGCCLFEGGDLNVVVVVVVVVVVSSSFVLALIMCEGFVFSLGLVSIPVLHSSRRGRESCLFYLNCILAVMGIALFTRDLMFPPHCDTG